MKKLGFKFVSSNIIYAFIQATGIVNDHITNYFAYKELTTSHNFQNKKPNNSTTQQHTHNTQY
ncbi:MAG: DNA-3-methyladenine glycosylase I [Candidatus Bathyarchaeota archaeon]|nr:DNA-3-methyladenine glycosylase I [Candidatus Termiticorpusculum sp.]